jgi:hypothetical protein
MDDYADIMVDSLNIVVHMSGNGGRLEMTALEDGKFQVIHYATTVRNLNLSFSNARMSITCGLRRRTAGQYLG